MGEVEGGGGGVVSNRGMSGTEVVRRVFLKGGDVVVGGEEW